MHTTEETTEPERPETARNMPTRDGTPVWDAPAVYICLDQTAVWMID